MHLSRFAALLPNGVAVEVINRVHVLIQKDVSGEGHVGVVSRLKVCHAAGGDAETSQHCRQADGDRDRPGMNTQCGLIKDACGMTPGGSAKMELANVCVCVGGENSTCGSHRERTEAQQGQGRGFYLGCI